MTVKAMFASCLLVFWACSLGWAQQLAPQSVAPSIPTHPIVEQLLQKSKQDSAIVELQGYVGPSTPDAVRLYSDLSLSRYWEIPRSDILHEVQGSNPTKDPTTLYVKSSTMVASTSRMSAETAITQRAVVDELNRVSGRSSQQSRLSGPRAGGICIGPCSGCLIGGSGGLCLDCVHAQ